MNFRMSKEIIEICKKYIEENNIDYLQLYYKELTSSYDFQDFVWPSIFHRLYLHACLRKKPEIAKWFESVLYPTMDPIQQIALRQIFPYGNYLLNKN